MSIEYDLELHTKIDTYRLIKQIADQVFCLSGAELLGDENDNSRYRLINQYFTLYISYSDEFQAETVKEVYGINTNMHIGFRIHDKSIESERCMMQIVEYLIAIETADFVLEYNGEFPVVLRQGGMTKINHEYDDGSKFPFDIITGPVEVIKMPCQ